MLVRRLTDDDAVPCRRLGAQAFGGPMPEENPRPFSPGEVALGIDSASLPGGADGVLAAVARVRRDRIVIGGREVGCGGVAGLVVHPAHRGEGLFHAILGACLDACAEEQLPWSMLYPSHPGIYRRHGFQVVARTLAAVVPIAALSGLARPEGLRTVPVTDGAFDRVRDLYRASLAGENGMLLREGPLFPAAGMPGGGFDAVLVEDDAGQARGYMSYTHRTENEEPVGLDVHEVVAGDRAARIALLRSLAGWSTSITAARIRLRSDDPVLDVIPGGTVQLEMDEASSQVMMRVVDVAAALRARGAPTDLSGHIALEVQDERSGGSWQVTAAGGDVTCEDLTSGAAPAGTPTATLDIHALSLLLAGGRRVTDAERLGLGVRVDPAARAFLDTLVAGPRPSVMDAF
ncbi:MAG: GNAT family N-acetyltransferase [Brachybacterium sp.]|nr:GNAT family N-acetyltransferase [Brachybacterium sp.]